MIIQLYFQASVRLCGVFTHIDYFVVYVHILFDVVYIRMLTLTYVRTSTVGLKK